ncbi:cytochrome P450 [Thamnidium elegans]|uniref:Cytochrome P450 n=1 Tax=Thamnidium elegans TaxID=101142 RepID=A0A8H7SJP4_9FUNG|nr:hypothetical protein INT48_005887 [Thamnidium elegans]KAI8078587.1 cytochrome P450 [Thamnidium elegans]BDB32868.1 cytochrome P450 monooxygenase [Thamnidium elegans]
MDRALELLESFSFPKIDKKEVMPIVSIAAATTILFASYRLLTSNKKNKQGYKEIPVPGSSYPYVGHILSLGDLPGRKVSEWHKELGPLIKLKMGVHTWIMVDDPEIAHKIFVSNGVEASYRPHSTYGYDQYSMGGKGVVFAQPTAGWKQGRAAVLSVLAPKQIEKYMDSIHKESKDLVSRLMQSTKDESEVNPFKFLELNSMNVILTAAFGKRFDSVQDPEFYRIATMIETGMKFGGLENDLPNFLPVISIFDYMAGTQAKQRYYLKHERDPIYIKLIKDAATRDGPNVIKSLVENGFHFTDEEKLVLMSDFIAAGTDTVSVTLSWNIAIMCHHPEVQKAVSAEIDEFIRLNGRTPVFTERTQLPYCVSVIKECMRFRPTTPFGLPHTTHNDLDIDGYIIPKGATIISNMDSMHKQSKLYPEPEKFMPERFINNLKTMQASANGKLEDRDHFNFGWGRRICPAIYLAEVEIFSAFIQIFSRCFVEPTSEGMPDIVGAKNAGLTIWPLPYKVKFTERV